MFGEPIQVSELYVESSGDHLCDGAIGAAIAWFVAGIMVTVLAFLIL